jgi:hypothetical protein
MEWMTLQIPDDLARDLATAAAQHGRQCLPRTTLVTYLLDTNAISEDLAVLPLA